MTKEDLDFIGSMNMCGEISNEAYKKIVCHFEGQEPCDDCISRQAVLDMDFDRMCLTTAKPAEMIRSRIEELPSVQPKTDTRECGSCKYSKDGRMAGTEECHECMWESKCEPKTDTWSIKDIAKALEKHGFGRLEQEPKTGHWIVREDNTSFVRQIPRRWVECSHCHWSFSLDRIKDDYCSKCGAKMEVEEK